MEIKMYSDYILVKVAEPEKDKQTESGLFIPASAEEYNKKEVSKGVVVAVGPGRMENGNINPMRVKVGDNVIMDKYNGSEVIIDNEKLFIVSERTIFASY